MIVLGNQDNGTRNVKVWPIRRKEKQLVSPLILELPGFWRWPTISALFLLTLVPALPLLTEASGTAATVAGNVFAAALGNTLVVAAMATITAFAFGLPIGVALSVYEFPGRRFLGSALVLPLLLQPFLLALGWTMLLGPSLAGPFGAALVFSVWIMPLVAFAAYAAGKGLSATAIEAARLAGGERRVVILMARYASVPGLAAAGLGAALSISDPGPGQVFGLPTAASEILTSFAALNDFGLAARQSLLVAVVIVFVAAPLAWFTAPRMARALMAREVRQSHRRCARGLLSLATFGLGFLIVTAVLLPILGLTFPATSNGAEWFPRALSEAARTAGNTVLYASGAGLIAVFLGFVLALAVGRDAGRQRFVIAACFFVLCLPPALLNLGLIRITAAVPAWTDPIFRSQFAMCLVLGLRVFPIAAVLALRSWASAAPSWTHAAALHGVSLPVYARRILVPHLLPAATAAFMLCGLLALADIGTALLLHPPGAASFPLAIFTVMANAPEALVAWLALVYVGTAAIFLLGASRLVEGRRT